MPINRLISPKGQALSWTELDSDIATLALGSSRMFNKSDSTLVAFTTTTGQNVSTQIKLAIDVGGVTILAPSGTTVSLPTLTAGTDYAIWAQQDGTLVATANFISPPSTGARKIGGFHYAPGSNAAARAGGDTTPQINPYSFWDLKWKPNCTDPRGMALVANNFWADIYLLNTNPDVNGTSKYGVQICDGSSVAYIPTAFGGNGSTQYSDLTWWTANEILAAYGKRSPSYQEMSALAFGTTEGSSIGSDQVTTQLNATYTSKWGVIQSTGVINIWGRDFGGGAGTVAWTANTGGRGSTYQLCNAVVFGGYWNDGTADGSRCSLWNYAPTYSSGTVSARGIADHSITE